MNSWLSCWLYPWNCVAYLPTVSLNSRGVKAEEEPSQRCLIISAKTLITCPCVPVLFSLLIYTRNQIISLHTYFLYSSVTKNWTRRGWCDKHLEWEKILFTYLNGGIHKTGVSNIGKTCTGVLCILMGVCLVWRSNGRFIVSRTAAIIRICHFSTSVKNNLSLYLVLNMDLLAWFQLVLSLMSFIIISFPNRLPEKNRGDFCIGIRIHVSIGGFLWIHN